MKPIILVSACGLALTAAAACAPATPPTQRVALDCPAEQGDLKLKTVAPDKKTCDYVSDEGDQVELRLIPVSTTYEAALQPIEQELKAEQTPGQQDGGQPATVSTNGSEAAVSVKGSDASATVSASGEAASAAAKAAKQAEEDAQSDHADDKGDRVSIGTGGVNVGANDSKGDRADIDLPGLHISADDDNAHVNVGSVHVDAGEEGATVRVSRDVRLRGEAFSRERRGFRATYILAKDNLKDGWKAVGYEAAGPKVGPISVAVFKARQNHGHNVSDDVKRLVRRNGGI